MGVNVLIGYCGVCCDHCGMRTRISEIAKNLKRFIEAYGYAEWIHNITQEFNFDNLMKGLNWLANSTCPGCHESGGMPRCGVRACCFERKLENCYFCDLFPSCEKLNYQKETYNIEKNFENIKQTGYAEWLREQEKKCREEFDNIKYLEKKHSP